MNITGNVLIEIKKLPDFSQDIIFGDPPYNLGSEWYMAENGKPDIKGKAADFMGKWNGLTGPELELMFQEFFRVLKYGSYCVFAGQMRQAMPFQYYAIAAGFDMIEPIYSYSISNFPKALDVGKALDKIGKRINMFKPFSEYIKKQRQKKGLNTNDIGKFFFSKSGKVTGCYRNWEYSNNVPTKKQYEILKPLLNLSNKFDKLIDRIECERKVISKGKPHVSKNSNGDYKHALKIDYNITAPSSDLAKKYNGIKSSICPLKQTTEVWFIFRKPFKNGTIVRDIIAYEDGDSEVGHTGLNIDAGRVPTSKECGRDNKAGALNPKNGWNDNSMIGLNTVGNVSGRYPAQLFFDGSISYKREDIDLKNKDFLEFVGIDPDAIKYMDHEKALDYVCAHLDKFDITKLLDKQSGVLKSTGRSNCIDNEYDGINNGHGNNFGKFNNRKLKLCYNDEAGCSRIGHNASFVLRELYQHIYYSKPSGFERDAGCDDLDKNEIFGAGNYSQSPVCSICRKTINGINNHEECEENTDYKIEYIRKEENDTQKNNHPTLKSLKLLYNIVTLFNTVDIKKKKILIPFSGVRSEKIAWLAHGAIETNITAIEVSSDYHKIGEAREKFWIENNFFFRDDKIMQGKIKNSIESDNKIKKTGQGDLF